MIETAGPPFALGLAQGRELGVEVRSRVRALRRRYGWLAWVEASFDARAGPGRRWARFLPQQHERLLGIGRGAGCAARALELRAVVTGLRSIGSRFEGKLEARFALLPEVRDALHLRRTSPDAVGFESVEIAAAWCPGALAGVNAAGVAVVVLSERGGASQVPLRVLAQDVLLRGADLDGALSHLRLRARYAGGSGALALVDRLGGSARVELTHGVFECRSLEQAPHPPAETDVLLDPARRELVWFPEGAPGERATLGPERTRPEDQG